MTKAKMNKEVSPNCMLCEKKKHGLYAHNFHETHEHARWLESLSMKDENIKVKS